MSLAKAQIEIPFNEGMRVSLGIQSSFIFVVSQGYTYPCTDANMTKIREE